MSMKTDCVMFTWHLLAFTMYGSAFAVVCSTDLLCWDFAPVRKN